MQLNQDNLEVLPSSIQCPLYNRDEQKPSIVHIGVGGFHRAHQAFFLDELLNNGLTDWTICGMGLKPEDNLIYKALKEQDYLYTLVVKHSDNAICPRVIGSIVNYIFVPDNHASAIEKLSDPQVKIVSLTITEGGYNFDTNGYFIIGNPDIQWDIHHPQMPKTVFGLLAAALKIRKERNIPAFAVLSCDNIQHNGDVAKKMLLSFTDAVDTVLSEWIQANVCFPNSMVDRITPVTTENDSKLLNEKYGIEDACSVTCEPFIQWVLEDNFPNGRPAWEKVGVQFVPNIDPYEKMKIRLLNAGHSFLGLIGSLAGYDTIDESMNDPLLQKSLRSFMDEEVTPLLGAIEGMDLEEYKNSLFRRFENPNIKDQLTRICSESSAKLPKFLIPTILEQLERNGPIRYGVLALAAWCRTLELYGAGQYPYPIQDALLEELTEAATLSAGDQPLAFIEKQAVFGPLSHSFRWEETYLSSIHAIRTYGVKDAILRLCVYPQQACSEK
ncbi:MAG: mannitol dehydrogenase family protein [Dysgonamonadaceae bacterium]|jgi:mannitol 2-dehydrogenase|nr:mannitol dehydrogenase family protein [Dysgonamonadaceae bacterium]